MKEARVYLFDLRKSISVYSVLYITFLYLYMHNIKKYYIK